MPIFIATIIALTLVVATVLIHYEMLRGISILIPRLSVPPRARMLFVIGGVFIAHLLEVFLYAFAYVIMHDNFDLGRIGGNFHGEVIDFFYFSMTSYTTLGVGDVYPQGPLRIVAAIEALNGFALIGWSASFTYLAMEKFWDAHTPGGKRRGNR